MTAEAQVVQVSSGGVFRALCWAIGALLLAHVSVVGFRAVTGHRRVFGLVHLFDFFSERNIPTLFSALLLGTAASLLCCIYAVAASRKQAFARHWGFLSLVFLFLAADEVGELHERLSRPVQELTGILPGSFEYWGWVLPYALLTAVVGISYLRFLFHLPLRFRLLFAGSAALFVGGAVGCEVLEGIRGIGLMQEGAAPDVTRDLPLLVMVTLEELFEMLGIALFIYALLEYLKTMSVSLRFEFKS